MTWSHTDFDEVFAGGRFGDFTVSLRHIGDLVVASGGVAVFDPEGGSRIDVPGVPVGTFPIEAAVATYPSGADRIACVRVVFERERAATWDVQARYRDRPRPPFEVGGVYVESGWLAFADSKTNLGYARREDIVDVEVRTHDQEYPVYLGRTREGRPTALAVDSWLLTIPLFESVELALPFPIGRLDDPLFARAGVEAWATSPNELELRGDIARLCVGRVGDPAAKESIAPIVQTRPSFVQRLAFTATSGRAFVKVFVGHRSIAIK